VRNKVLSIKPPTYYYYYNQLIIDTWIFWLLSVAHLSLRRKQRRNTCMTTVLTQCLANVYEKSLFMPMISITKWRGWGCRLSAGEQCDRSSVHRINTWIMIDDDDLDVIWCDGSLSWMTLTFEYSPINAQCDIHRISKKSFFQHLNT
jgi:hypothetical protein